MDIMTVYGYIIMASFGIIISVWLLLQFTSPRKR